MATTSISKTQNFFVEGSGTARVIDKNNNLSLIHLQDMTLEITSTMENIYGGEGNFALYSYNTEKGLKVTFTNASWNLDILNLTQGTKQDSKASIFYEETVKSASAPTGNACTVTLTKHGSVDFTAPIVLYDPADNTVVFSTEGSAIDGSAAVVTTEEGDATVGTSGTLYDIRLPREYANQTFKAVYNYYMDSSTTISSSDVAIASSLYTTGIPGFVTIHHKSKPMRQKNGRIIRVFTTIFRARCDGHLTMDFKHKNAFAPELAFEVVDPERTDKKYMIFGIVDTTSQDKDNANTTYGF